MPSETALRKAPVRQEFLDRANRKASQLRIADAAFQSQRCGMALAYASLLTELLPGMTLAEAATLPPEVLMSRFGGSAIAGAAAGLAIAALRRALAAARVPAAG